MSGDLAVVAGPCVLHKQHRPKNQSVEWHHVMPRSWQRAFVPAGATVVNDSTYGPMWDERGVWLCPTGHRNVHIAIDVLMHASKPAGTRTEVAMAKAALERFVAAGGSLDFLRAHGLWGQA